VDEADEASQADDGSTQNVDDWGHSRFDFWTRDVDGNEWEDDNDVHTVEEEEASEADDGSPQNVEDWGHSTWDSEDWTIYFRQLKYHNGNANATASNVSEVQTVLP
jgi:hypothetical protein